MSEAAKAPKVINGVNLDQLFGTLDAIKAQPVLAKFKWKAENQWMGGAHNRTSVQSFYGANQDDSTRARPFVLDAGEPPVLVGTNTGPNPAEALLHALAACLTTSLVYVAAARGVNLTEVESTLEGEMDLRGALGLSEDVRNGYEQIRVTFKVKGDAPPEKLQQLVDRAWQRSAVYDSISRGVPISVKLAAS